MTELRILGELSDSLTAVTQATFIKLAVGENLVSVVLPRPSRTNKLTILISED